MLGVVGTLLGACGQLQVGGPSGADVAQNSRGFPGLIDTGVGRCQQGEMDGVEVQVCDVCVISIHVVMGDRLTQVMQVRRSVANLAFRRAISYDQPSIAPAAGQAGVWAVASSAAPQTNATANVPTALTQRAGFQGATGLNAMVGLSVPTDVLQRFSSDAALRQDVSALVGTCADGGSLSAEQ